MRIVYLNPCGQMGGAETSLRELLASMRTAEPEWQLWLVLGEDGPLAGIARNLGVRVVILPFPTALARIGDTGQAPLAAAVALLKAATACVAYTRQLRALLRDVRPDIVHTNGLKMHLMGCRTSPRKTPVVWHIHDYVSTRRVMGRLLRHHYKRCALAIANSNSVAADLRSLMPALRVRTVHNAVDLHRFAPQGSRLDLDTIAGMTPAPAGTVRVGLVSTFARWKGHKVFLQALSQLPGDAPVRAYVVGGPIYQTSGSQWSLDELHAEAAGRLGLGGKVGFTGFLEDTAAAMRSLDIIVHASTKPEPFGMVIVEGMACARAVIASQDGGAAEIFVDGENALGHPPGDATALARQILRLAHDAKLRRQLGEAGRETAERLYHGSRLAEELLAVYREIGGERAAAEPEASAESSLAEAGEGWRIER